MTGGVTSLPIVTLTPALVVRLPAASRATAESVWLPLAAVVVFHGVEYGAAITSAPRFAPSSLNCTPTTATLSVAAATTETVPDTLAFGIGAVIETAGAVPSSVAKVKSPEVARFPAASRERTR